jgi:hypothetical protein
MEQNTSGHFEQFLKEATADFKLRPSKRLWNSIYNNMHPGRKYPSATTILLMLVVILFMENKSNPIATPIKNTTITHSNNIVLSNTTTLTKQHVASNFHSKEIEVDVEKTDIELKQFVDDVDIHLETEKVFAITTQPVETSTGINKKNTLANTPLQLTYDNNIQNISTASKAIAIPVSTKSTAGYAYQFYATPSFGYRSTYRNTDPSTTLNNPSTIPANMDGDVVTSYRAPSWNLEAGGAFLMNVSKFMRVKAGMQFNFSQYGSNADEDAMLTGAKSIHPNSSLLNATNNESTNQKMSDINNRSYQISLPIGTEFELTGNDEFQWYAGATIQPSYLFGGNKIMISNDIKNMAEDPFLMRKWNINTSIETYLSYKLKNGAVINAGPQLRYQLLSTYDKSYIYSEKLYNFGIKLGVTKNF